MSALIELDHPINVNGIAIRFVPIRFPTDADLIATKRAVSRKWRRADREMAAMIAASIDASDPRGDRKIAKDFLACALIRTVTGLPFHAIAQLGATDQAKIGAFLDGNSQS